MRDGGSNRIDRLVEVARTADARLDDLARTRVLHGIQRQLTAEPPPRVARPWRRWSVGAIACAVAATAAVVALRLRSPASLDIMRPYVYQGGAPNQELLIEPTDRLTLGLGELARVELAALGRLTLRGPAQLRVTAVGGATELELERGQLFVDFDGTGNQTLIVRSPGTEVRVRGTLFAVVAEAGHSDVVVGRGSVEVRSARGRYEVRAGEALRSDGVEAVPGPIAALLAEHDRSLLPPRGSWGLVALAGAPATVRLPGEQRLLGVTPLVARVPVGRFEAQLVGADGEQTHVETEVAMRKTNAVGYVLTPRPALAAPRVERPMPTSAAVAAPSPRAIAPAPRREPSAPPPAAPPEPSAEPSPPTAPTATQLYEQAEAAMRGGQPRAARDALQRLIERFPEDREAALARYELARLAFEAGEWQAADDQLAALRGTSDPTLGELSASLDCRVAFARGALARATTCIETFRRRFPRSPHDREMLALLAALRFDEDCERARPLLAEYLARYPRGPFAAEAARGLERCAP